MPLVWRGAGIIVPIIFIVSGLLVYWIGGYDNPTLGNGDFMGWTLLWSGIVVTLIGIPLILPSTDENGNKARGKHDFFWIPVLFWGILFLGVGIYLRVTVKTEEPSTNTPSLTGETLPDDAPLPDRKLHFYNPTDRELTYILADETADGLISREKVAPHSFLTYELPEGDYLLSAFDPKTQESTITLPVSKEAITDDRYIMHEDEKGSFYQRIFRPATKSPVDYDDAWFVIDGKTPLLLVDITSAADKGYDASKIGSTDWAAQVVEELDPTELIEPLYSATKASTRVYVHAPGEKIELVLLADNEKHYLLVPYGGQKDKSKLIAEAVKAARP